MTADGLARLASLYTGILAAGLILFLTLIARFYQRRAQVKSGYWLFLPAALLVLLSGVRYAAVPGAMLGDGAGDLARFVGGLLLFGEGAFLLRLMTGRQP